MKSLISEFIFIIPVHYLIVTLFLLLFYKKIIDINLALHPIVTVAQGK